ncbi:MAG: hypothetical protein OFPII_28800 [Osedax symbiont Rs1]|nr:MAG: hypothetical protein OFPII_28800 [Osedax symbiont Rs1]
MMKSLIQDYAKQAPIEDNVFIKLYYTVNLQIIISILE